MVVIKMLSPMVALLSLCVIAWGQQKGDVNEDMIIKIELVDIYPAYEMATGNTNGCIIIPGVRVTLSPEEVNRRSLGMDRAIPSQHVVRAVINDAEIPANDRWRILYILHQIKHDRSFLYYPSFHIGTTSHEGKALLSIGTNLQKMNAGPINFVAKDEIELTEELIKSRTRSGVVTIEKEYSEKKPDPKESTKEKTYHCVDIKLPKGLVWSAGGKVKLYAGNQPADDIGIKHGEDIVTARFEKKPESFSDGFELHFLNLGVKIKLPYEKKSDK